MNGANEILDKVVYDHKREKAGLDRMKREHQLMVEDVLYFAENIDHETGVLVIPKCYIPQAVTLQTLVKMRAEMVGG